MKPKVDPGKHSLLATPETQFLDMMTSRVADVNVADDRPPWSGPLQGYFAYKKQRPPRTLQ